MKYCENCGAALGQDDKFCGSCGHKSDTIKEKVTSQEEFTSSLPDDQTLPMTPINPTVESYQESSIEKGLKERKTWVPVVIVLAIFALLITVLVIAAFVLVARIRETGEDRSNVAQRIEYELVEEIEEIEEIDAIEEEEVEDSAQEESEEDIDVAEEELEDEDSAVITPGTEESELAIMEEFLGTWLWFMDEMDTEVAPVEFYHYYFDEDGTGVRGTDSFRQTFSWSVTADGILKMDVDGSFLVEEWNFTIDNYVLLITSRQVFNMEYTYVRVAIEGAEELIGRWEWDEDENWYYIFEVDGYGSRPGMAFGRETFAWLITADGGLAISPEGDDGVEMWSYEINDEGLTLISRQVTGMEFSYIRGE